jgi:YwiC-like protein
MNARIHPNPEHAAPANLLTFPQTQMRKILVPREHGSWGMWLLPLFSGAFVGLASATQDAALPVFWFCVAAAAAFLAYQPLEALLGLSALRARTSAEKNLALAWTVAAAALGSYAIFRLVHLGRAGVVWFAAMALASFGVRWAFGKTRAFRASKQIIGAMGLTAAAAGAYYVTTGKLDATALSLWAASWLFAAGQIEFVQLCIRTAAATSRAQKIRAGMLVFVFHLTLVAMAVIATQMNLAPALLSVAFVPALVRMVIWGVTRPQKINFQALGFAELFQNILFACLLAAAFLVRL